MNIFKRKMLLVFTLVASFLFCAEALAYDMPTIKLNGVNIRFSEGSPVLKNDRIYVPIGDLARQLGWDVTLDKHYGNNLKDGYYLEEHDVVLKKLIVNHSDFTAGYRVIFNTDNSTVTQVIDDSDDYTSIQKKLRAPILTDNNTIYAPLVDIVDSTYSYLVREVSTNTLNIITTDITNFPNYNTVKEYAESRLAGLHETYYDALKNVNFQSPNVKEQIENDFIKYVNIERERAGMHPVKVNATLMDAAQIRVKELTRNFSHTRPNGTSCKTVMQEVGWLDGYTGENISLGYNDAEAVVIGLMNSPKGHRINILNPNFNHIGVAFLYDENGLESKFHWVQIFSK